MCSKNITRNCIPSQYCVTDTLSCGEHCVPSAKENVKLFCFRTHDKSGSEAIKNYKASKMLLEVCVDSIESLVSACEGGAGRIELCSALSEGGLTPTCGFLKIAKKLNTKNIPIFAMLRPTCGNSFVYTNDEMEIVLNDLVDLRQAGADGFVFGALTENGNIEAAQCGKVINAAAPLPVTFHRAFDLTNPSNMISNFDIIKNLGFKRILTSGFKSSAEAGLNNIKELIHYNQKSDCNDFIIMPGAGITPQNLKSILDELQYCKEFHASARIRKENALENLSVSMGSSNTIDDPIMVTDKALVQNLIEISNIISSD